MRSICLSIVILAIGSCVPARAECQAVPPDVQEYLRSEPGWTPVDTKDLPNDDKSLWEQYHRGSCPGIAVVDLDGQGGKTYALALLNDVNGRKFEKLVVVRRQSGRLVGEPLVSPYTGASPSVVWRAGPGTYRDWTHSETVNLTHDSIIYEKLEATATQYYFADGKFKLILTSN